MGVTRTRLEPDGAGASREFIERLTAERLDEARESLKQRFLVLAPRRVALMQEAAGASLDDAVARRELQRLGHQLRGTAATVGLPDLGLLGGVIEGLAAALPYTDERRARVAEAVALVAECVRRARDGELGSLAGDPRFDALVSGRR